jgi:hypothetical protein
MQPDPGKTEDEMYSVFGCVAIGAVPSHEGGGSVANSGEDLYSVPIKPSKQEEEEQEKGEEEEVKEEEEDFYDGLYH